MRSFGWLLRWFFGRFMRRFFGWLLDNFGTFFCLCLICNNNSATWLQPLPYWRLIIHGCGEDWQFWGRFLWWFLYQSLVWFLGQFWNIFFCLSLMCNNSAAWLQPPPYWRLMIHGCGEGRRSHHFYVPASNQAVRSRKIPTPKRQADRDVGTPLVPRANGPTFP